MGMFFKGDGGGLTIQLLRQSAAYLQQRLMTQMHTVEKTQGKYFFCCVHAITSFYFNSLFHFKKALDG
jgi:hypothetical protein